MASILSAVFAVVVVGGAAAIGYAIYLSSGFVEPTSNAQALILSTEEDRSKLGKTPLANQEPLRILVVDDSESTRRILRMILGLRKWTICGEAEDGLSGVAKFDQLKPDVVLLDLALPDIDGIKAAKRMSASNPTVPIILFTILASKGIESVAQDAGIRAVVSKTEAWDLIGNIETVTSQKPSWGPH